MMSDRSPEGAGSNTLWVSLCIYSRRPTKAHCLVADRLVRLSGRRAVKAFSFPSTDAPDHCSGEDLVLYLDIAAFEFWPEVRVAGEEDGRAVDGEDVGGDALREEWRMELDGADLPSNEPG